MKEALKLALDVLMENEHYVAENERHAYVVVYNEIIEKCKEALVQPAQEPVAWLDEEEKIIYWHNTHETDDHYGFRRTTPLYTTPQQRPWVGLTEAQFLEAVRLAENGNYLVAFVRIQEWLKEKNT